MADIDEYGDLIGFAEAFSLTPDQFVKIAASAYPAVDLQLTMQAHIYNAKAEDCRARIGWQLLPAHVERRISHAWTVHHALFLSLAEAEYARHAGLAEAA